MYDMEPNSKNSARLIWLVLTRVHNYLPKNDELLSVFHCNNFTNTVFGKMKATIYGVTKRFQKRKKGIEMHPYSSFKLPVSQGFI